MKTTLISFVGTGMYKDGEGYEKTEYIFPDGKKILSNIFVDALLRAKYREFEKIILVGTITSGFDMLVEDDADLWAKVRVAREGRKLNDEIITEVQNHLSEKLNVPVIIKCHTDKIDDNSSEQIFNLYSSIVPEIKSENILFDITHSFRSMPVLLYQALQFSVSQNPNIKSVEIVYGEFTGRGKPAFVRSLSSYWKYSEVSDSLSVFEQKLDGFRLADLIRDEWESGSKAIKRFSEIVQTNFCLQIKEVVSQIRNALKKYPENAPDWLGKVKVSLEKISSFFGDEDKKTSQILFDFSKYLYSRSLNVQAVICLQVSVESFICEHENSEERIGDYDWWQDNGRKVLNKIKGDDWANIGNPLTNLEHFRNQIAHGGAKMKSGGFPHAANIPNIYKSGLRGTENLFKNFEEK